MRVIGPALPLMFMAAIGLMTAPACDDGAASYDYVIEPGTGDDYDAIQTVLIAAESGSTIGIKPGTYALTRELTLSNSRDITIVGMGKTRDEVVLDFAGQTIGDDGMTVTSDGFAIENLTIKNTPGNGIVVGADTSRFTNIKVTWDAGSVTTNGAYAVYPHICTRTVVEDSEIVGAADAGIYVGSCEYAIVRRNTVYANVAGIEIENSRFADVYDNTVYDNTAGILVFALPNLSIKECRNVLVRDNSVYDNNRENFAEAGTIVAEVPAGLGMLVLASKDIEIKGNDLKDNGGTAIMLVSFGILDTLAGIQNTDEGLDPYAERIYVHGNTYTNNGTTPGGAMFLVADTGGVDRLEDILWDGDTRSEGADPQLCLGGSNGTFRDFDGVGPNFSTDKSPYECTLSALPEMPNFDGVVVR